MIARREPIGVVTAQAVEWTFLNHVKTSSPANVAVAFLPQGTSLTPWSRLTKAPHRSASGLKGEDIHDPHISRRHCGHCSCLLLAANPPRRRPKKRRPRRRVCSSRVRLMSPEATMPCLRLSTQLAAYAGPRTPTVVNPPCTAVRGTERITCAGQCRSRKHLCSAHRPRRLHRPMRRAHQRNASWTSNEKWLMCVRAGRAPSRRSSIASARTGSDLCPRNVPTVEIAPTP
jgi:hypothetical protein